MNYGKFLKNNLIKKQNPDFKQIELQLQRSLKDLQTANENLNIDLTWTYTIAYHAMIRAGRALMYSKGFLPTTKNTHKTIVEFTKLLLGNNYETTTIKFDRMRRRRHDFIYDSINHMSLNETKSCLTTAKKLIDKIFDIVKNENPQKDFL
jgi:uncharacterized protein (UPF0332 family)